MEPTLFDNHDTDSASTVVDAIANRVKASIEDMARGISELLGETDNVISSETTARVKAQAVAFALINRPELKKVRTDEFRAQVFEMRQRLIYLERAERAFRFLLDLASLQEDSGPRNPIIAALRDADYQFTKYRVNGDPTVPATKEDVLLALEKWMRNSTFGLSEDLKD